MWRVVLGFLVCALAFPAFLLAVGGTKAGLVAGIAATLTGSAAAFIGLPLFFWFREKRWLTFWHCVAGGAIPGIVFSSLLIEVGSWMALLLLGTLFGVIGAIHGAVFWLVAICGNKYVRTPGRNY